MLKLVDKVLEKPSTGGMVKSIKKEFRDLFQVERVNILLVNRYQKFFFKIQKDKATGSEEYVKYEMQQGLAGYAAACGNSVLSEHVANDVRFVKAVDDPKGTAAAPPLQILTVPVFARNDHLYIAKGAL